LLSQCKNEWKIHKKTMFLVLLASSTNLRSASWGGDIEALW
jgi:hypothetical protein